MNYTTAIFLINKNARAVAVTYEADDNAKREIFKTLDDTISVDDFVTVETNTRHKMTVCKVVEVDVDFDLDSTEAMRWIVAKVDQDAYASLKAQEEQAIKAIKSAELRQKRDNLRDSLLKDHLSTIKALPIADMNGEAPEAKE